MALSSNVLALLLALLSVSALAVPPIAETFTSKDSRLELSHPVVRGNTLYLVATNTGVEPGIVESTKIKGAYVDAVTTVRPATPSDAFVPQGFRQVAFKIEPKLSGLSAISMSGRALIASLEKKPPETVVTFVIRQAHGSESKQEFRLSHGDMDSILTAHAERCAVEKQQTTENGCVGLKELREKYLDERGKFKRTKYQSAPPPHAPATG